MGAAVFTISAAPLVLAALISVPTTAPCGGTELIQTPPNIVFPAGERSFKLSKLDKFPVRPFEEDGP